MTPYKTEAFSTSDGSMFGSEENARDYEMRFLVKRTQQILKRVGERLEGWTNFSGECNKPDKNHLDRELMTTSIRNEIMGAADAIQEIETLANKDD